MISRIYSAYSFFLLVQREYWIEEDSEIEKDIHAFAEEVDSNNGQENMETAGPAVLWIVAFVSLFQTLYSIPEKAISWLLLFLSTLLKYCGKYSQHIQQVANNFPHTSYLKLVSKGKWQYGSWCLQAHSMSEMSFTLFLQ